MSKACYDSNNWWAQCILWCEECFMWMICEFTIVLAAPTVCECDLMRACETPCLLVHLRMNQTEFADMQHVTNEWSFVEQTECAWSDWCLGGQGVCAQMHAHCPKHHSISCSAYSLMDCCTALAVACRFDHRSHPRDQSGVQPPTAPSRPLNHHHCCHPASSNTALAWTMTNADGQFHPVWPVCAKLFDATSAKN